ncbi:MAG TPA: hypothetical protein VFQ44_12915 [Streptosporangiaceae bacterium]|nr:hypothetical protein [Streptosporangiaceae bacterium]
MADDANAARFRLRRWALPVTAACLPALCLAAASAAPASAAPAKVRTWLQEINY